MQKFVAVIGTRNSGKSTVIKSLTGCPLSTFRGHVEDKTTGKTIHVLCNSPQETPLSRMQFRNVVQRAMKDPKSQGLVMAIQPTRPHTRLSLEDIFQEVVSTSAFELHAFILDPARNGGPSTSAAVLARLKAFRAKILVLDGQRFAHINAQLINRRTRVAS